MSLQVGYLRPELQGCSPLASQQQIMTTWKFFPTGSWQVVNHANFCSYALSPTCTHAPEHTIQLTDTGSPSPFAPQRTGMPGGHPDLQGTLKSLLAPGMFLCWFFPLTIFPLRGFLEGFCPLQSVKIDKQIYILVGNVTANHVLYFGYHCGIIIIIVSADDYLAMYM